MPTCEASGEGDRQPPAVIAGPGRCHGEHAPRSTFWQKCPTAVLPVGAAQRLSDGSLLFFPRVAD